MLRNALRLLMFSLLLVAFLPLFMLGMVGYTLRLKIKNRGTSGTAYEPLFSRLMFHYAGTRDDRAAVRLAPHLPALHAWHFGAARTRHSDMISTSNNRKTHIF